MEKNSKKKDEDIDEQYLMSMMAEGTQKEGLVSSANTERNKQRKDLPVNRDQKLRKKENFQNYEKLFICDSISNARNGKSVYIRPEFHERLTRIVQVIGEDKISLYAYLDNVLDYHFREFGDQIKKSFDDKYKPIF